jgi:periplasmic protein TonB
MFEASLIESSKHQASGKRWLSVPLSILIHVLVIGTTMAASMWYIEEIPEPPIPVSFYANAAPPPPPPPPPAKAATAAKSAPKVEPVKPTQVTSPMMVPDVVPVAPAAPEPTPSGVVGGVEGGVEGGVAGGVMGGVLGGKEGGVLGGQIEEPMRVGGEVREPREISRVQPQYPEAARKARLQGIVILEAIITKSGSVESVRILRGLNPLLDSAAMQAVSRWKYEPATFNGRTVPVYLTVTVTFKLQ